MCLVRSEGAAVSSLSAGATLLMLHRWDYFEDGPIYNHQYFQITFFFLNLFESTNNFLRSTTGISAVEYV